jgi:hypothetical protein
MDYRFLENVSAYQAIFIQMYFFRRCLKLVETFVKCQFRASLCFNWTICDSSNFQLLVGVNGDIIGYQIKH